MQCMQRAKTNCKCIINIYNLVNYHTKQGTSMQLWIGWHCIAFRGVVHYNQNMIPNLVFYVKNNRNQARKESRVQGKDETNEQLAQTSLFWAQGPQRLWP